MTGRQPIENHLAGLAQARDRSNQAVLALLFASGATLGLISLALPHSRSMQALPEAIAAASGYPTAVLVYVFRGRLPAVVIHALLGSGTALVSAGIYFAHGAPTATALAFFYVWVGMYAARCFGPKAAGAHLGLAGAAYAGVLGVVGGRSSAGEWALVMGTAATVAAVVANMRRRLVAQADTDALTGLANRVSAQRALVAELSRARRCGVPLSLAVLDLDRFKEINDALGHQAGDRVLAELARTWRALLRPTDVLARYGGDEFLLLLPGIDTAEAEHVLARLASASHQGFSAGLVNTDGTEDPDQVVARADEALYSAKRGRGTTGSPAVTDSRGSSAANLAVPAPAPRAALHLGPVVGS